MIAAALHSRGYRAVGMAMSRNPNAPRVPCHRVVRSSGNVGGYAFGVKKKVAILRAEGIEIVNNRVVDLQKFLFDL